MPDVPIRLVVFFDTISTDPLAFFSRVVGLCLSYLLVVRFREIFQKMKKFVLSTAEIVFDIDNLAQIIKIINLALGLYFLLRRFLNRRKRK